MTVLKYLLQAHDANQTHIQLYGDNQGVQHKCDTFKPTKLKTHREPNTDLFLEYNYATRGMHKESHWVASHQDKDTPWDTIEELKGLKLSHEANLNVLCDQMAENMRMQSQSYPDADVLPSEKWALFSNVPVFHKITCKLDTAVLNTLYTDDMVKYITKRYSLSATKLDETQKPQLERYLRRHKPLARASIVKLIHKWIPTNAFLHKQRRNNSPLCPRCQCNDETAVHIYQCPDASAMTERQNLLYQTLKELNQLDCPEQYLHIF